MREHLDARIRFLKILAGHEEVRLRGLKQDLLSDCLVGFLLGDD